MLNYYQPSLWPFLRLKRYTLPEGLQQYYFFSFEDGLWELLRQRQIPVGSVIFIPDFYCIDVVENIEQHGYRVVFYPLDEHFQIEAKDFSQLICQHHPRVVVIFHACGITSQLVADDSWPTGMSDEIIVIEDNVQRLTDPEQLTITRKNHLVMDSLRKVSPLQGSMMYGHKSGFDVAGQIWQPHKGLAEFGYVIAATAWYTLFRMTLGMAMKFELVGLTKFAHEVILKKHDDLVGDSTRGYLGWSGAKWVHSHFNFARVAESKTQQVIQYQAELDVLLTSSHAKSYFYSIHIPATDFGKLHVFPVGLRRPLSSSALNWLHQHGAVVWSKFPDAPWSRSRGVLFLPLGFHVSNADIVRMMNLLHQLPQQLS